MHAPSLNALQLTDGETVLVALLVALSIATFVRLLDGPAAARTR